MSMGEQLVAADMHVKNMWEPTGWDSPETAETFFLNYVKREIE